MNACGGARSLRLALGLWLGLLVSFVCAKKTVYFVGFSVHIVVLVCHHGDICSLYLTILFTFVLYALWMTILIECFRVSEVCAD